MEEFIDDLTRVAVRCQRIAERFDEESLRSIRERVVRECETVHEAWSGSWIGNHAHVYIQDLQPAMPGEVFDAEWGMQQAYPSRTHGRWSQYTYQGVREVILSRAGITEHDLKQFEELRQTSGSEFDECKGEMLAVLDAMLASASDATLKDLRDSTAKLESYVSAESFVDILRPQQVMTRDYVALQKGLHTPHHLRLQMSLMTNCSCAEQAKRLGGVARQTVRYLQKKYKTKGAPVAKREGPIFIGHGRSLVWRELKDFLVDTLSLDYEEFNREATAGLSTKERLVAMLDKCCFAFLVLTAEDVHADGSQHARENVIHEVGLLQGRYGFERAIVLLEDGCEEFSNIAGIGQIRFPKGNVKAAFEEIRGVIRREGIA